MAKGLTEQQQKVLAFVEEFAGTKGFPPTLREIGQAVGLNNITAVRGHLLALEKKGYIAKEPDKARGISLIARPSPISRLKRRLHEVLRTDQGVLYNLVYGLGWCTRGRERLLTGEAAARVQRAIAGQAVEHGWRLIDCKVAPDHVAVVVETWPNHSPEQTVRRLQNAGRAALRRNPLDRTWGAGYAVTTDPEMLEELVQQLLHEQDRQGSSR